MPDYLPYLQEMFGPGVGAISRAQFRTFMGISVSTDNRMYTMHLYPRCIAGERIALPDLAEWLKVAEIKFNPDCSARKRGRPVKYPVLFLPALLPEDTGED